MAKTNGIKCECCGQSIRQPKALTAIAPEPDKASMSDAELHAYCKRIGLRDDCRFFLRYATDLDPSLRLEAESLLEQLERRASKPADVRELTRIKLTHGATRIRVHRIRWALECAHQAHLDAWMSLRHHAPWPECVVADVVESEAA